jgi:4-hydroxyphenylpyruvate dioxygenase
MQKWSDYYERLFNFREIRYFDIKGAKTGLVSKAMTAPDGIVRIPLNESNDPKVADQRISRCVSRRRHPAHRLLHRQHLRHGGSDARERRGEFLDTPDAYFEVIDERVPNHGEDVPRLRRTRS